MAQGDMIPQYFKTPGVGQQDRVYVNARSPLILDSDETKRLRGWESGFKHCNRWQGKGGLQTREDHGGNENFARRQQRRSLASADSAVPEDEAMAPAVIVHPSGGELGVGNMASRMPVAAIVLMSFAAGVVVTLVAVGQRRT